MAIVVVGGQTRNIGKTSVVAGIVAALPQYNWVAFKVSQHGHGEDNALAVIEEREMKADTDSARFLQAGAVRSFWVRSQPERLEAAMPDIRNKMAAAENVIFESNSILRYVQPDLYLTVLCEGIADCKESALDFLDRADAVLLSAPREKSAERWPQELRDRIRNKPQFPVRPATFVSAELLAFVEQRLARIR